MDLGKVVKLEELEEKYDLLSKEYDRRYSERTAGQVEYLEKEAYYQFKVFFEEKGFEVSVVPKEMRVVAAYKKSVIEMVRDRDRKTYVISSPGHSLSEVIDITTTHRSGPIGKVFMSEKLEEIDRKIDLLEKRISSIEKSMSTVDSSQMCYQNVNRSKKYTAFKDVLSDIFT